MTGLLPRSQSFFDTVVIKSLNHYKIGNCQKVLQSIYIQYWEETISNRKIYVKKSIVTQGNSSISNIFQNKLSSVENNMQGNEFLNRIVVVNYYRRL